MPETPEEAKVDPLVPWLDSTIERLEATRTDAQMRAGLQVAVGELQGVAEDPHIRKLLATNLQQAAETLTREQASTRLIPRLRRMRDDLAAGPRSGGPAGCGGKAAVLLLTLAAPGLALLIGSLLR